MNEEAPMEPEKLLSKWFYKHVALTEPLPYLNKPLAFKLNFFSSVEHAVYRNIENYIRLHRSFLIDFNSFNLLTKSQSTKKMLVLTD
jgi:hypothetical protein